ncbi:MAG: NAD-dependent epimerase/dehydratase family protein [Bacteroidales bacterium]|jgi:uncharacterized protein YbjT (DUF2867 family)|nr:NAD-dependent epimerase/dehydratase family protein [Bacteroidales bacterium]
MQKTAIVFGASGLTGSTLLNELIQHPHYQKIKVFNRRSYSYDHPNVEEHLIDFSQMDEYAHEFKAEDVFCCLGTTLKKAGSREKFRAIDHDLPVQIARICLNNQCETFIAISSIGARAKSSNYYLRTKGNMEQDILNLDFRYQGFVRPSMLLGSRKESRPAETAGKIIMKLLSFLLVGRLKKYRGIHVQKVAKAMITIANHATDLAKEGKHFFESDELQELAEKYNHDRP